MPSRGRLDDRAAKVQSRPTGSGGSWAKGSAEPKGASVDQNGRFLLDAGGLRLAGAPIGPGRDPIASEGRRLHESALSCTVKRRPDFRGAAHWGAEDFTVD